MKRFSQIEARAKQAVAGGKVQKLITGFAMSFKGKKYDEIDFELVGINNNTQEVTLRIIGPKEIFGNEIKIPFRTLRRGRFMATDTSKESVEEAVSPAQQAAIAIAKKKSGKYDKDGNRKEEFEVHYMYKDGKKKKVEKPEEHDRLSKLGWVHKEETKYDYGTDASVKHMKKMTPGEKLQEAPDLIRLIKVLWSKSTQRDNYKRALEVLKGVIARKKKETGGKLQHDLVYYAQEIGKQFKGIDARELAKMYGKVSESVNEAVLTVQQRRARGRQMKRLAKRIAIKRMRKMKRVAGQDQLKKRANKAAKQLLRKKIAGKRGEDYKNLSPQQKFVIDKMVEKKAGAIPKIAMKLLPKIKKAEKERIKSLRANK